MANEIPVTKRQAIKALRELGYSKRKIARQLGLHRKTVGNYLGEPPPDPLAQQELGGEETDSKCTISTPGSEGESGCESEDSEACQSAVESPEPEGPNCGVGRQSHCEPYREIIEGKLEAQLHAKRIWQDLVDDHGFSQSYQSVKRFVRKLKKPEPKLFVPRKRRILFRPA